MDPRPNLEANDPDQPIAWRAVPQDTPVWASGGQPVGTLYELLGSDQEDIFHGIVVQLRSGSRRVFVPADHVTLITATHVNVDLGEVEIGALAEHTEERQFELGAVEQMPDSLGWVQENDR